MITANPFEVIDSRLNVIESLLSQIVHRPSGTDEVRKDIGGLEIAIEETGLSRSSIYRMVHLRTIPHFKNGGKLYFSRKELRTWITKNRRDTQAKGGRCA